MKFLSLMAIVCSLFSSSAFAKIITKAEVKKQFIAAVQAKQNSFLKNFKLDEASVEVSQTRHPLFIAAEVIRDEDFYQVSANFKQGNSLYHYSGKAQVEYLGVSTEGNFSYDVYFFGTFESGRSFTRASDEEPVKNADVFLFKAWSSDVKLWP